MSVEGPSPLTHNYADIKPVLYVQVDGSLYRVHRYHLEHGSEYFRRLLRSCTSEDNTAGKTDETAIAVTEVTQGDFDCLLNFLYYKFVFPALDLYVDLLMDRQPYFPTVEFMSLTRCL